MMNRYMCFFRLPLELMSVFRIAGRDEDSEVLQDGEGRFIIPGTSIAGAVKAFWQIEFPKDWARLLGSEEDNSQAYFYDAICENVQYEKRVGVKIDDRYGVVKKGQLYSQYFIGQGMKCDLRIQFAISETDRDIVFRMIQSLVKAINIGRVRFGAKKVNGAGVFRVKKATYRLFDLEDKQALHAYLDTDILEQFSHCNTVIDDADSCELTDTEWMNYQLTVDIPDGLLVRSGEKESGAGSVAVNMSKMFDGEERYYIPASTIKGLIRSQASRIGSVFGIEDRTIQSIFGHDSNSDFDPMAGAVYTEDCLIEKPKETIYHRLKIDRLTGAGMNGALLNEKVLSTETKSNTVIRVAVDRERLRNRDPKEGERLWKIANAFVFLTMRDLGTGRLTIGSGESVGYGYMEASSLKINELECVFDAKTHTINAAEGEAMIQGWLSELEVPNEEG